MICSSGIKTFKLLLLEISSLNLALLIYQYTNSTFIAAVFVKYPGGYVRQISPDDGGIYYEANTNNDGPEVTFFRAKKGTP